MESEVNSICNLLESSSVWCSDENYTILCQDIKTMERYIVEGHIENVTPIRERAGHYQRLVSLPLHLSLILGAAKAQKDDQFFMVFMHAFCIAIRSIVTRKVEAHNHSDRMRPP